MKLNKLIYFLLFLLLAVQVFAVVDWSLCGGFADKFRFSQFDLQLRLIEGIHTDHGVPIWQVRVFHNKLIGSVLDVFASYLQFWRPGFLTAFLSIAGFFGVIAGWYYFLSRKKRLVGWLLFGFVILMPFVEMFSILRNFPLQIRVIVTALPFLLWSLFGYFSLLQEKKFGAKWIIVLLLVSLWYQLVLLSMGNVCVN